ncbi:hypothetical protein B0H21DRAFT_247194 [Amylocystis lapponica]|nr:hypothetical protein B0H21DRAFT_247194 [Amylocystis lapponica]
MIESALWNSGDRVCIPSDKQKQYNGGDDGQLGWPPVICPEQRHSHQSHSSLDSLSSLESPSTLLSFAQLDDADAEEVRYEDMEEFARHPHVVEVINWSDEMLQRDPVTKLTPRGPVIVPSRLPEITLMDQDVDEPTAPGPATVIAVDAETIEESREADGDSEECMAGPTTKDVYFNGSSREQAIVIPGISSSVPAHDGKRRRRTTKKRRTRGH